MPKKKTGKKTRKRTDRHERYVVKSNNRFLSKDVIGRGLVAFADAEIFHRKLFAIEAARKYFILDEQWDILPVVIKLEQEFEIKNEDR